MDKFQESENEGRRIFESLLKQSRTAKNWNPTNDRYNFVDGFFELKDKKIDKSVIEAAHDLGCNNVKTMFKVVVPLSMPGIMSGITMVFVPAISTFIISRMLGGGSNLLIGDLIEMQFLGNSYNPNLGAAISLVLMVIILLIMTILNQFDDDEDKVLM